MPAAQHGSHRSTGLLRLAKSAYYVLSRRKRFKLTGHEVRVAGCKVR